MRSLDSSFPSEIKPIALVTGGAKRIGAEVVSFLAQKGMKVVIHCNSSVTEAEALSNKLQKEGCETAVISLDLREDGAPEKLINFVYEKFSGLGVLVNNASVLVRDDVKTFNKDSWNEHADTDLFAPIKLIQLFAEKLGTSKGCVINMLDARVLQPTTKFTAYTLAKTGLWTYTRMSAEAFAPSLRVNALGIGLALPGKYLDDDRFAAKCADLPLKEGVTPKEIAQAVWSLVCLRSVTGQILALDSGLNLKQGK